MRNKPTTLCPCGSTGTFEDCCGAYLAAGRIAPTAEKLMRSRYTAFALAHAGYLLDTWHASTRPPALEFGASAPVKWLSLKIVRTEHGADGDSTGVVEFVARFKVNGKAEKLHEVSRFVREEGRWYYVDGDVGE